MKVEDIIKNIRARKFEKIYFLAGEEAYYIDLIYNELIHSILKEEEREFNQSVHYGLDSDVQTIIADAKRFPMMSEYNVVAIKEAQNLKKIEELESYFSNPIDSTILIISYKNKKLDKRKTVYKTLQKNGLYFESNKLYENQVPDWIVRHLSHAGYHISVRNAMLITEYLGTELSHITNELGKIILNLPEGSTIAGDEIEQYIGINKEYNTFELNNALGHRNIVKANRIVNYFGQNEKKYPLLLVVGNLYAYFSKVLKYHYVSGKSKNEQAAFLGVNPFFIKDYEIAGRHYNRRKLIQIMDILSQYDMKSKGLGNATIPDRELLKEMVYKIIH